MAAGTGGAGKGGKGGAGRSAGGAGGGAAGKGGRSGIARGGQGGRAGKPGSSRKGAAVGSGGNRRRGLEGKGPTPPAEMRPGHPAQRRAAAAAKRATPGPGRTPSSRSRRAGEDAPEIVAGRNSVVEALRAGVPATALYVLLGRDRDERIDESVALAAAQGVTLMEAGRTELDRMSGGPVHQGIALQVPPFSYAHPEDVLETALSAREPGLVVALDGVTDPRNLGAVLRSAAAFGAHGVVLPERRAAGVTAAAWKTSAGAAARLPVARATNLVRTLGTFAEAGLFVVGLAADGEVSLDDLEVAADPLVVVVGSEGKGLGRLTTQRCDLTVRIPIAASVESLNAGIAAAVTLAEVARRRRTASV